MKFLSIVATAILSASSAFAGGANDMMTARELGQIVGSAEICSYDLDADKVADVVSDALAKMEAVNRSAYQTGSSAQKSRIERMTSTERKVTCATQAKLAAKYGILAK